MSDTDKELVSEIKRIRELMEPKHEPMRGKTKTVWDEYTEFLKKYGVIGLAVGFIIGGASRNLVNAHVVDILKPIITFFIPAGACREAHELIL